jgi:hypothetical protein
MTQVASAEPAPPEVPPTLVPQGVNKVFLVGHTDDKSFQIYKCTATGWVLDRPSATLLGDNGKVVATHFAGPLGASQPTWQATDGSTVVGKREAAADAPPGPAPAIPWLLLSAASTAAGHDGDRLVATTFIQRVNTTGGVAPTTGCSSSTVGAEQKVLYTAVYYFWKKTGNNP